MYLRVSVLGADQAIKQQEQSFWSIVMWIFLTNFDFNVVQELQGCGLLHNIYRNIVFFLLPIFAQILLILEIELFYLFLIQMSHKVFEIKFWWRRTQMKFWSSELEDWLRLSLQEQQNDKRLKDFLNHSQLRGFLISKEKII